MLTVLCGTRDELCAEVEKELVAYRYEVFIKTLGWNLPCDRGVERDQFDRDDTVYIIAKDETDTICGCARLLPTTRPYLLAEVFPELLCGTPIPRSNEVWELSRFSTLPSSSKRALTRDQARERFRAVFAAVAQTAMEHGAKRLITFTALGVERILRVIGIHAHRIGPPALVDEKPVLALWVELDRQTSYALDIPSLNGALRPSSLQRVVERLVAGKDLPS